MLNEALHAPGPIPPDKTLVESIRERFHYTLGLKLHQWGKTLGLDRINPKFVCSLLEEIVRKLSFNSQVLASSGVIKDNHRSIK
jgi:hypothetical protein